METWYDHIILSRLQFAVTAMFHILWPLLTVGLSLFLVAIEVLWLKTRDAHYYYHARFWGRLLLLNFGIGVVSGILLELEFGTNWAGFSAVSGDFMGNILGFDLGVGVLSLFTRDEQSRRIMMHKPGQRVGCQRDMAGGTRWRIVWCVPAGLRRRVTRALYTDHPDDWLYSCVRLRVWPSASIPIYCHRTC